MFVDSFLPQINFCVMVFAIYTAVIHTTNRRKTLKHRIMWVDPECRPDFAMSILRGFFKILESDRHQIQAQLTRFHKVKHSYMQRVTFHPCILFPRADRLCIKGSFSLNCVLGVTWVFGLLYIKANHAFAYIFTIFNASQVRGLCRVNE